MHFLRLLFFFKLTGSHDEVLVELESHEWLGETPERGQRAQSASVSLQSDAALVN